MQRLGRFSVFTRTRFHNQNKFYSSCLSKSPYSRCSKCRASSVLNYSALASDQGCIGGVLGSIVCPASLCSCFSGPHERVLNNILALHHFVLAPAQGRIEGVMAYKMGQRNVMGAYPFHFHLLGFIDSGSSYIVGSSVFNSFYRASHLFPCAGIVLHGTSGVQIIDNVAFHVDGNCFYLEDGVEESNWLEHNLAAFVHPIGIPAGGYDQSGSLHIQGPDRVQPADAAASGFYSGNPNNVWLRNAASGGFAGFSFPVMPRPIKGSTSGRLGYECACIAGISRDGRLCTHAAPAAAL
eukprot:1155102-Pelagomonas_calceolata.AAC.6